MNINFDALSDPNGDEPFELQSIFYGIEQSCLPCGVPHLFHSRSVARLARRVQIMDITALLTARSCNVRNWSRNYRINHLPHTTRYCQLPTQRAVCGADPLEQKSRFRSARCLRTARIGSQRALCLQNVTADQQHAGKINLAPYQTLPLMRKLTGLAFAMVDKRNEKRGVMRMPIDWLLNADLGSISCARGFAG